jgi:hypothetical protein
MRKAGLSAIEKPKAAEEEEDLRKNTSRQTSR